MISETKHLHFFFIFFFLNKKKKQKYILRRVGGEGEGGERRKFFLSWGLKTVTSWRVLKCNLTKMNVVNVKKIIFYNASSWNKQYQGTGVQHMQRM